MKLLKSGKGILALIVLLVVAVIGIKIAFFGFWAGYSDGQRIGTLHQFTQKGVYRVGKGELLINDFGVSGGGKGATTVGNNWTFNVNDDEIIDFATFGRDRGVTVRFIEYMPLDADGTWEHAHVVPQAEIVRRIAARYPLEAVSSGSAPAERFRYLDRPDGGPGGEVGVIPSVTRPFCETCDRVRLTAEGQLRNCLFAMDEFDLRSVVRDGGSDDDVAAVMHRAVGAKWAGHAIGQVQFVRPPKSMSQIGG